EATLANASFQCGAFGFANCDHLFSHASASASVATGGSARVATGKRSSSAELWRDKRGSAGANAHSPAASNTYPHCQPIYHKTLMIDDIYGIPPRSRWHVFAADTATTTRLGRTHAS